MADAPSAALQSSIQAAMRAINALSRTNLFLAGNTTSDAYTSSVVLSTQAGWVATVQVLTAGSAPGFLYNSSTSAGAANVNKLMEIQNTVGLQQAQVNFSLGLLLVPGTGQWVNVTYSLLQQPTGV